MKNSNEPVYIKKSVTLYKIYAGLFVFAIIMSTIVRPLMKGYPDILDLLVGLPIFAMFILAPIGLYYSWKSYKMNEGLSKTRFIYFMGHLFFCILMFLFIIVFISDISKLF